MHAQSSGSSHAVLTIWDGQILQPPGVPRTTPNAPAGLQLPHRLPVSHFSPRVLLFCWPSSTDSFTYSASAQLRKVSKIPQSCGSNPSAGKPYPDGFTPSPPSSAPCGTGEKARKMRCMLKLSIQVLPTFNLFLFAIEIHFKVIEKITTQYLLLSYFCTVFPSYICLFSIFPSYSVPKPITPPTTTSAGHTPPGEVRGASCWPHGEPRCFCSRAAP